MRHPLHAICPYFAMFPEEFVARQVLAFTQPGDLVLDPFCGRGTTVFESLLQRRKAIGMDVNWVAACVAGAKAAVPCRDDLIKRLRELEERYKNSDIAIPGGEFFGYCFHPDTLRELCFLREELDWRRDDRDRFIAAVTLGALHGESHRSPNYLSNRMPRTISTKPEYSVRWWRDRNLLPQRRETFRILATLIAFRLSVAAPIGEASVIHGDARNCGDAFDKYTGEVKLMVTSPPYLDTTDYSEDQWLRLWLLGGSPSPTRRLSRDDRYRNAADYWQFLTDVWKGCASLLAPKATIVIRIGGRKLSVPELADGLLTSLRTSIAGSTELLSTPNSSEIRKGQVNSFRPGMTNKNKEHDFVFRIQVS